METKTHNTHFLQCINMVCESNPKNSCSSINCDPLWVRSLELEPMTRRLLLGVLPIENHLSHPIENIAEILINNFSF